MSEEKAQTHLLEEILTWIKVPNISNVKSILNSTLDTPQKKLVFHLCDGKSNAEISKISKVSAGAISGYWNSWRKLGLVRSKNVKGGNRYIKIFDLEDFDIKVPTKIEKFDDKGEKTD